MKNKICAILLLVITIICTNLYSEQTTKEEYEKNLSRLNKLLAMQRDYSSVEKFLQYEVIQYPAFHIPLFLNADISSVPFTKGDIVHVPQKTAIERYYEKSASDGKHIYLMTVLKDTGDVHTDVGHGIFYLESDEKLYVGDYYGYGRSVKRCIEDSFYMEYIGNTTYRQENISKHCWAFRLIKNLGHWR